MFSDPARAKNQEYTFAKARVNSPFPAYLGPHTLFLSSLYSRLGQVPFLNQLTLHLAPTLSPEFEATSLAIPLFLLALNRAQTTRCAQTVKKTGGRRPLVGGSPL
jgi:hypothetical protein